MINAQESSDNPQLNSSLKDIRSFSPKDYKNNKISP